MLRVEGMMKNKGRWTLLAMLSLWALTGCVEEYDFTRQTPERGTFGEEVYRIVHKDARRSPRNPGQRLDLLERERQDFITSLDGIVPQEFLTPLDHLLRALGPLQDSDLLPDLTRKIAHILEAVSNTPALHQIWAQESAYQHHFKAAGVNRAVLEHATRYPRLDQLSRYGARLVLDNDGFNDEGQLVPEEPVFMGELSQVLADLLQGAEVTGDEDRFEALMADLLLRTDRRFSAPGTSPMWAVRVDSRGMPLVSRNRRDNLFSPFSDRNGDGLADINTEGRFVDFNGTPLDAPAFGEPGEIGLLVRDGLGRAFVQDEGFVFEYIDLHQTSVGFLLRETPVFVEEDVPFDLLDSLKVLLPPRVTLVDPDTGDSYRGYPPDNPVLDTVYGALQLMDFAFLDELLDTVAVMLREHDNILAELLFSVEDLLDRVEGRTELELTEDNTLRDDLLEALEPIVMTPGLMEDLLVALQDPVVLRSADAMVQLLSYKADRAVPAPDGAYNRCFRTCERQHDLATEGRVDCVRACPSDEIFVERMDRSLPSGPGNRSHFERTLAMLRTVSGVEYQMHVVDLQIDLVGLDVNVADALPPLLGIEDAADAYVKALAGDFRIVDAITDEAVNSPTTDLLVDGLGSICQNSILDQLIRTLVPVLINVTERDIENVCTRFDEVSAIPGLSAPEMKRQRLAIMVSFLSLLSDVPMDEVPRASQLARFFNSPNPSLDLSLARMTLSQLVDHDGYFLWEHHGDMLFAAEASGFLDAVQPLFKVFSRYDRGGDLIRVMAVLDQHYPTPDVRYMTKAGLEAPRAGRGTGMVRWEESLHSWLLDDRLFPALQQLATVSTQIESRRGRKMSTLVEEVTAHAMRPDAALTMRDGRPVYVRPDGEMVSPINRLHVVLEGLGALDDILEADPVAQEKWDSATGKILDLVLEIDKRQTGEAYFAREGGLALGLFGTEILADKVRAKRDEGLLHEFITRDLYLDVESVMTGRTLPAVVDMVEAATATPEDRALLKDVTLHLLEGEGAQHTLVLLYELLVELSNEEAFVTLAQFWGEQLDPDRVWESDVRPLPLLSHGALLLDESLARDPDLEALLLLRRATARDPQLISADGDPLGLAPWEVLADVMRDYNRVDPSSQAPLTAQDYQRINADFARWLQDDARGMEQIYQLVKSRKK